MIGFLAALVMLAAIVGFLVGLVSLAFPLKRIGLSRRRHGAMLAAGAFALFMVAGFGLPKAEPDADAVENAEVKAVPVTLATVDPTVTGVSDGPDGTFVYIKTEGWDDASYVFTAGDVTQKIGQALQAGAPDGGQAPNVVVTVATTGIDRLGKESDLVLMAITFDRADLVAANFDNLSVGRTLNLATDISYGPAGARALLAYCQTDRGLKQSQPFCRLAESLA
ncbi:MAG: hypothetical protein ACK4OJ_07810 [Brevundimonas sp.]